MSETLPPISNNNKQNSSSSSSVAAAAGAAADETSHHINSKNNNASPNMMKMAPSPPQQNRHSSSNNAAASGRRHNSKNKIKRNNSRSKSSERGGFLPPIFGNNNSASHNRNQQEVPLPFQVAKDEETVQLPISAFTPRENPAEERRRLELLELYWNNANPNLNGLFSEVEPIDRFLAKTHGGESHLAEGLRNSVFLQDLPRSNLQRRLDLLSGPDVKRQANLRNAARRAIHKMTGQDFNSSDDEEADDDGEKKERRRRNKEKKLRIEAQNQRREELRARFFAGEDIGLTDQDKMRLGGPGARQAQARGGVSRSARNMKAAADAHRRAQQERRMEEEREKQRRAAKERAHRETETAVERERREFLAQKRAERDAQRKEEEARLRKAKEEEDSKKSARAAAAREAARKKAEEEARKKAEEEAEAEFERQLKRKKSMTFPEPKYRFEGPEGIPRDQRKVYECLEEGTGMLFRVVETDPNIKGKRWHFYNDTDRTTFFVKITFLPPNSVRPIGDASLEESEVEGERGEVVISCKIPPLKTVAFSEGQVKGFSAEIEAEEAGTSASGSHSGSFSPADDQEGQVPLMIPIFKNGAPEGIETPYEVYECFEGEGILFRIVKRNIDDGTQKWWYYNDDTSFGMKISTTFGAKSSVKPLGNCTKETLPDSGKHVVKGQVGCLATIPFMEGHVRGFQQEFDIVEPDFKEDGALPDESISPDRVRFDRTKKLSQKDIRKLIKELQKRAAEMTEQFRTFATRNELTANPSDEQKLLVQALKNRHFYIDLQFPPIMDSISLDDDQREELVDLCWMKAQDLLDDQQAQEASVANAAKAGGGKNAAVASQIKQKQQQHAAATSSGPRALPCPHGSLPNPRDIEVGAIPDWWVLGAIATLAHEPSRITSVFKHHPAGPAVEKREVSQGIFRVRMLVGGWWHDVIVDDWLPIDLDEQGHPALFFAKSAKGPQELWVSLLEKAIAKTSPTKCYTDLGMGEPLHIIEDITGYPSVRLDPRLEDEEEQAQISLFNDLKQYLEKNWIVCLNTAMMPDEDDEADKLQETYKNLKLEIDCCYRVTGAADFTDHLGTTRRLLKISNPWGTGKEWKGAWSWGHGDWKRIANAASACKLAGTEPKRDSIQISVNGTDSGSAATVVPMLTVGDQGSQPKSSRRDSQKPVPPSGKKGDSHNNNSTNNNNNKIAAGPNADEPGTFWMEWKDIKKYFTGAGVCYTQSDWHDYRVKGRFENGHPNLALEVRCVQRTRAYLLLMQSAESDFDEAHPDARYTGAVLSVCSRNEDSGEYESVINSDIYFDKPSKEYTFVVGRALGCEFTFEPSEDSVHLIIPRCYSKTCNKDYVLAVILDQPVGEETISFRFKQLDESLGIFDNYPQFSYSRSVHSKEVAMDFQYKPPQGRPQLNLGFELEGAPSDLVAGRMSRMQGGATPSPGASPQYPSGSQSMSLSGSKSMGGMLGAGLGPQPSMQMDQSLSVSGAYGGGGGGMRPVSSLSFDIVTDVLVHIRNCSELPFEVNAIGIYDFRGIEVFRSTRKLVPATNKPSWANVDLSEVGGIPLGYLWNSENRNLTFKLLMIDEKDDVTPLCEGKTTWDDATVAAKLANEKDGKRPVVALRLRPALVRHDSHSNLGETSRFGGSATDMNSSAPNLAKTLSGLGSTKRDVIGTLAVSFSAISRVTEESQASYFSVVFDSCIKVDGGADKTAKLVVIAAGKDKATIYETGESMPATPKEDMFSGSQCECVLHNNHRQNYLFQLRDGKNDALVFAEAIVTPTELIAMSGTGQQHKITLKPVGDNSQAKFVNNETPFIKCRVQGFRADNF